MIIFSYVEFIFACNDGSKTHSFIKTKVQIMFLVGNQMEYKTLNLRHYMLLSYIKFFAYKMGMKFDKDPLAAEQKNTWPKLWTSMDYMIRQRILLTISNLKIYYLEQLIE